MNWHRRWARVLAIKEKVSIGITDDDKSVMIPCLLSVVGLQVGDYISFIPLPPRNPFRPNGNNRPIDFFAQSPKIIGHAASQPNTQGESHDASIRGLGAEIAGAASAVATASGAGESDRERIGDPRV
jgi:hypothetical protein